MSYQYFTSTGDSNGPLPELTCIQFPGYGKNTDKMLEALGGIKKISEVCHDENRRMELRYRSDDQFCKPLCGERTKSTSLLLKIKYKKKKTKKVETEAVLESKEGTKERSNSEPCSTSQLGAVPKTYKSTEKEENTNTGTYEITQLGVVQTTYRFESMCDFQYLPVTTCKENDVVKSKCIYGDLLPKGMIDSDWLDQPAPLFLPPATFSRMDTPQDYRFKTEPVSENSNSTPQNVICRTRQKRTHFAIFHAFKDEGVPQNPLPGAVSQIRYKLLDAESHAKLKEQFNSRPIWSKNALRVRLKFSKEKLKYLMPTMSYYFNSGPWRNLWVKLGYDPRIDPTSWCYQSFDFRVRQAGGAKTKVEAKRNYSNYILPYKSVHTCKKKTSLVSSIHLGEEGGEGNGKKDKNSGKHADGLSEEFYMFRPGMIPPYRQMFYQYCDIHVPKIQKLLESSILTGANDVCNEKTGWLPLGVETTCRNILSNLIEKTLAERNEKGENLKEEELVSNTEDEESSDGNFSEEENA